MLKFFETRDMIEKLMVFVDRRPRGFAASRSTSMGDFRREIIDLQHNLLK